MKYLTILVIFFAMISCDSKDNSGGHGDWSTSLENSLKQAKAQNKYIFALFTGSDWCPPCKKLHHDILESQEFEQFSEEKFVKVMFDFPKKKENQLSPEMQNYNNLKAEYFGIEGFPTVIIFDSNMKEKNRWVGYNPTTVQAMLEEYGSALK